MSTPSSSAQSSAAIPIYNHGLGAFTEEELDKLERYCDALPLNKAALAGLDRGGRYDHVRRTRVATIVQTPEIVWFYDRLVAICRRLNRDYRFELTDFSEPPQYLVYRDDENGHFDWHVDHGTQPPRKLSLTLQLTDPSRYEGGELQLNGGNIVCAPRDRGAAIAFPSYTVHRVTPVTAGTRKSIVAWITGPGFK
jgi:PKHD-type hydroxylase